MGKIFHKKNGYSDEEFEDEELESEEEFEDEIENSEEDEEESEDENDSEGEEDEEESEDEDDFEEDEDDRRTYRRRRRIRNQIIAYAVVFVILAMIAAGGMMAGRNVWNMVKERRLADEQAKLQEEMQAQLEAEAAHDVVIDAPEALEGEPEEDYLGREMDSYISGMPLEDKVAGLFIVTPEALTGV